MGWGNAPSRAYEEQVANEAGGLADLEARATAEKRARVEAEGERLARLRANEADEAARLKAELEAATAAKRAEQLAKYREQKAGQNPATPGGPAQPPREAKTLYSPQAQQARDAASLPAFGTIMPLPNGQARGLNGVSLKSLMAGAAAAESKA